jgi:Universal stress protein UspA and related nucleotide-binding proteins
MATKFQRILVGVDDSADALLAFKYALHQAKRDDAALYIVSVLEKDQMNVYQALDDDFVHGERQTLETHLQDYRQQAEAAGITQIHTLVAEGQSRGDLLSRT